MNAAIERFQADDLSAAEAMLASARLAIESLKQFREEVLAFRAEHGDAASKSFAHHEFNDLIADLQDAIPPTIRAYNALLRDPDQKIGELG